MYVIPDAVVNAVVNAIFSSRCYVFVEVEGQNVKIPIVDFKM
jgi:hypothetical protein